MNMHTSILGHEQINIKSYPKEATLYKLKKVGASFWHGFYSHLPMLCFIGFTWALAVSKMPAVKRSQQYTTTILSRNSVLQYIDQTYLLYCSTLAHLNASGKQNNGMALSLSFWLSLICVERKRSKMLHEAGLQWYSKILQKKYSLG